MWWPFGGQTPTEHQTLDTSIRGCFHCGHPAARHIRFREAHWAEPNNLCMDCKRCYPPLTTDTTTERQVNG